MSVNLYDHQKDAVEKLKNGSILVGGVGTGKSLTALAYYYSKVCEGDIKPLSQMRAPRDLYIITTARKRDSLEWEGECGKFLLFNDSELCINNIRSVIDSWNNIKKYNNIAGAFFIFDEQKVVGSGAWVKSFIRICQRNQWILLSATPGDTWMDFVPVFIANGYYKNRTEFIQRHVVYSNFSKFPKIDRFIEPSRLIKLRDSILVNMHFVKTAMPHDTTVITTFDNLLFDMVKKDRWHIYENRPIKDVGELCYIMRKVVNSDPSRLNAVQEVLEKHPRVIIFYNFDYELFLLRTFCENINIVFAEWNGWKHEEVPTSESWIYLVQYYAGAEAWNCIETNAIIFYSQSYSYKTTVQAAGRIDRLNTPYQDLYYYYFRSMSSIDLAIHKALKSKKNFNENRFQPNWPRVENIDYNREEREYALLSDKKIPGNGNTTNKGIKCLLPD